MADDNKYGGSYNPNPDRYSAPSSMEMFRLTHPMPDDHLKFALIITVFCCLPLGIVALVKSNQVKERYNDGDYAGSLEASRETKRWAMAGLILGVIFLIICAILLVLYIMDKLKADKGDATPETDTSEFLDSSSYGAVH